MLSFSAVYSLKKTASMVKHQLHFALKAQKPQTKTTLNYKQCLKSQKYNMFVISLQQNICNFLQQW